MKSPLGIKATLLKSAGMIGICSYREMWEAVSRLLAPGAREKSGNRRKDGEIYPQWQDDQCGYVGAEG